MREREDCGEKGRKMEKRGEGMGERGERGGIQGWVTREGETVGYRGGRGERGDREGGCCTDERVKKTNKKNAVLRSF